MFAASARIRFGTCGKRLYSVDQVLRSCLPATYLRARGLTVVQAVLQYKLMQSEPQQDSVGISRGLLKENVAQRLREEILSARIAPGEKIVEGKWAREYGVAQISVREALNILAAQGFVTKGHGRSARVLKLDDADIIHIYQLRGVLEGLAARIISERKPRLDDLEAALAHIEAAIASGSLTDVLERVQHFHLLLLEKADNPFLKDHGERLLLPLYAFTHMRAAAKHLDTSPWKKQLPLHRFIIEVLRYGNPQLAEQTLVHVTNSFMESALVVWAH